MTNFPMYVITSLFSIERFTFKQKGIRPIQLLIIQARNRFSWWKLIHPVLTDWHDFPMGLIVCYPPERGRHEVRVISDGRKQQGWPEATHGDVTRGCTTRRSFINVQRSTTERIVRCFIISFELDRSA